MGVGGSSVSVSRGPYYATEYLNYKCGSTPAWATSPTPSHPPCSVLPRTLPSPPPDPVWTSVINRAITVY